MSYDINNLLEYKGYSGTIEFALEGNVFHGKIVGIQSLISYEAKDISGLKSAFKEAVDDYLIVCEAEGFKPETPSRVPLTDEERTLIAQGMAEFEDNPDSFIPLGLMK